MQKKWLGSLIALLGLCLLQACEGGSGSGADGSGSTRPPELVGKAVVFGKVVDAESGQGLGGVQVKLAIGNTYELSTSSFPAAVSGESVPASVGMSAPLGKSAELGKATEEAPKIVIPDMSVATTALTDGDFLFRDIPAGTHVLTISKDGYAFYSSTVSVTESDEVSYVNASSTGNNIFLQKGIDLTVVVTSEGEAIAGVPVYRGVSIENIVELYYSSAKKKSSGADGVQEMAVTDQEGKVVFKAIPDDYSSMNIYVPAFDRNRDGQVDYYSYPSNNSGKGYDPVSHTIVVELDKVQMRTRLSIVGNNCNSYQRVEQACVLEKDDALVLLFNQPVKSFSGELHLVADDVSQKMQNGVYPKHIVLLRPVLFLQNLVLKLVPTEELKENLSYTFQENSYHVVSELGGVSIYDDLLSLVNFSYWEDDVLGGRSHSVLVLGKESFYVSPQVALSASAISYDNFNGVGNDAAQAGRQMYLKLPKAVAYGKVFVLGYAKNGQEVITDGLDGRPQPQEGNMRVGFPLADHAGTEIVNDDGCAATDACGAMVVNYVYPIPPNFAGAPMKDNTERVKNNVKLRIVATDAQGNQIDEVVTLPVH